MRINKQNMLYLIGIMLNLCLIVVSMIVMFTLKAETIEDFQSANSTDAYRIASAMLSNSLILIRKVGNAFSIIVVLWIAFNQVLNLVISLISYSMCANKLKRASINYLLATLFANGLFLAFGISSIIALIKNKLGFESALAQVLSLFGLGIPVDIVITTLITSVLMISSIFKLVIDTTRNKR